MDKYLHCDFLGKYLVTLSICADILPADRVLYCMSCQPTPGHGWAEYIYTVLTATYDCWYEVSYCLSMSIPEY
jgi:hypothetical protein